MPRGTRNTPNLPAPVIAPKRRGRKRRADAPPATSPKSKAIKVVDSIQVTKARMIKKEAGNAPPEVDDRKQLQGKCDKPSSAGKIKAKEAASRSEGNGSRDMAVAFIDGHETIRIDRGEKSASLGDEVKSPKAAPMYRRSSDPPTPRHAKSQSKSTGKGGKTSVPTSPSLTKMDIDPVMPPKPGLRRASGDATKGRTSLQSPLKSSIKSPKRNCMVVRSPKGQISPTTSPKVAASTARSPLPHGISITTTQVRTVVQTDTMITDELPVPSPKSPVKSAKARTPVSPKSKTTPTSPKRLSLPATASIAESHIVKPVLSAPSSSVPSAASSMNRGPFSADGTGDRWASRWVDDEDIPSGQLARGFRSIKTFFSNVWPTTPSPGSSLNVDRADEKKGLSTPPPPKQNVGEIDRKILTV